MRDPGRISAFCDDLKDIWAKLPDWRFMQLMLNFEYEFFKDGSDPFFLEDDRAINALKEYVNNVVGDSDENER